MRTYGRALIALGALVFVAFLVYPSAQQQVPKKTKEQEKFEKSLQAEYQALVQVVDQTVDGQPAPSEIPLTFENHYLKARDGRTYSPFVLTIPAGTLKTPTVLLYFRLIKKNAAGEEAKKTEGQANELVKKGAAGEEAKKTEGQANQYAFEDVHGITVPAAKPGDPQHLMRAFAVAGGEYDLYLALRERPAGQKPDPKAAPLKTTVYHTTVTVPDYWSDQLATSSIILADQVDQLTAAPTDQQMITHPYTFGSTKVVPSTDHAFTKTDNLSIIFLVYNTAIDANKKPDVQVDYNFHQQVDTGEKFFNRTNPQLFNAETLPPQFDPAAGHQLVAGQEIPLASFPEGKYRLEIRVNDRLAKQTLTHSVTFSVATS